MKIKNRFMRATALLLSFALIQVSFGPQAWAAVAPLAREIVAPVGGAVVAAGAVNSGASIISLSPASILTAAPSLTAPAIGAAAAPSDDDKSAARSETPAPTPTAAPSPAELKASPKTAGVGARIARFLKNPFGDKKGPSADATTTSDSTVGIGAASGLKPAEKKSSEIGGANEPPAPSASDTNKRSIKWFLGGLLVAQVGVEILALAMPLLMKAKFGGYAAMAHIAVVSSAAGIVGRLSGAFVAKVLGAKGAYIGATTFRLISIIGMVLFLMGPTAPLVVAISPAATMVAYLSHFSAQMVMVGFYSFNSFMQGIALTTEKSIPTLLLGNDRATMERFSSLQQWLTEIVGVTGPKAGGKLIEHFGFTIAIAVYPVMLSIAVGMYIFGIRIPKSDGTHAPSVAKPKRAAPETGPRFPRLKAWLADEWAEQLAADPLLRGLVGALVKFHRMLNVKSWPAKIKAFVDGLVLKAYLNRWIEKLGGKGNLTDADEQKLLSRSTLGWTMAALFSLAGFATFLLPVALPAYVAMIAFGVAEVIATQKLYSLIISRTKAKSETVKINAVAGASFAAVSTVALNLTGAVFDHFTGHTPFLVFSAAMIPVAAAVFFLHRMMGRETPENGRVERFLRSPRALGFGGAVIFAGLLKAAAVGIGAASGFIAGPLLVTAALVGAGALAYLLYRKMAATTTSRKLPARIALTLAAALGFAAIAMAAPVGAAVVGSALSVAGSAIASAAPLGLGILPPALHAVASVLSAKTVAAFAGYFVAGSLTHRLFRHAAGKQTPEERPTNGFKLLANDPVMRWAFLAYALLGMTNPLLYQILSNAFALTIVGGSATAASNVTSWITALYSFGGLLGAVYMWRESTLISEAKKPAEPASSK